MTTFDVILTNPPFQDRVRRGRTPHKLWIEFTRTVFDRYLAEGGLLCQVSPSSFRSPNSRVLQLMREHQTLRLRFETSQHFPEVGSTFADYVIRNAPADGTPTRVTDGEVDSEVVLDASIVYLPNLLVDAALAVHRKVVFEPAAKLAVEWDYVTCHNVLLHRDGSVRRERSDDHPFPVFHTNRQTWWSSRRQDWADAKKVMWTRSGYTRPFYDDGVLGGTDMAYFVRVASDDEGRALAANLNLELMRYVYATARWSGFGNERVFRALPDLPRDRRLTDDELFAMFDLSGKEIDHVRATLDAGA